MWYLKMRMYLLVAALFAVMYAVVSMASYAMGIHNFYFYLILCGLFMFVQYMIGPKIVEWSMKVKYIPQEEAPDLHRMVEDLAQQAGIPKPRVGISPVSIPNAFAFGRSVADGRVCVTRGILDLLNKEELRAVLGHEISHIKNRDVLTITFLSVIPIVLYRIAFHFLFFGSMGRRRNSSGNTMIFGLAALIFYFITNLLVLYASRIREYFADRGSISLGNTPSVMATALYKLVYGSARMKKDVLKETEGIKAFFVNDPSRARSEIKELAELDIDRSGTIDPFELDHLRTQEIKLGFSDHMMEIFSTHPNMLKRIKHLSSYQG